jgi:hypothetical protein
MLYSIARATGCKSMQSQLPNMLACWACLVTRLLPRRRLRDSASSRFVHNFLHYRHQRRPHSALVAHSQLHPTRNISL